jgi:hypothetical protein
MRVTGFASAVGAVILGIIIADLVMHPTGVAALGNAVASTEKVTVNGLLGSTTA